MYEARTTIDVGGIMHYSRESTLRKSPVISHILDKWRASGNADEHPFIDRDGLIFYHILNFLRSGTVVVPDDKHLLTVLSLEAAYFKLKTMETQIVAMLNES